MEVKSAILEDVGEVFTTFPKVLFRKLIYHSLWRTATATRELRLPSQPVIALHPFGW